MLKNYNYEMYIFDLFKKNYKTFVAFSMGIIRLQPKLLKWIKLSTRENCHF